MCTELAASKWGLSLMELVNLLLPQHASFLRHTALSIYLFACKNVYTQAHAHLHLVSSANQLIRFSFLLSMKVRLLPFWLQSSSFCLHVPLLILPTLCNDFITSPNLAGPVSLFLSFRLQITQFSSIRRWIWQAQFTRNSTTVTNKQQKQTPWPQYVSKLNRPRDRRLLAKLVPTLADRGCRVVSATDHHGHILGFLDRSRYYFFKVTPQLYSRGWVDPVPDPLLLRNPDLWICSQELCPLHQ
jgi:hypothetical protein